jgi:low temperature requirement protein LtrA
LLVAFAGGTSGGWAVTNVETIATSSARSPSAPREERRRPAHRIAAMRIAVSRDPDAEREVSPLELFFDLVYVFAISQLSHHLVEHVDLRTGAETAVLALAVFYAWYMVAWGANWLDPDPLPVRAVLVGLMFASLLMSVAIGDAFGDRAWLFVTGYLVLQITRAAFLIVALRGRPQSEHFVNDLVWELLTGVLWVAGAVAGPDARLVLWGLAVAAGYGGAWAQHWLPGRGRRVDLDHTEIAGRHLVERFRLFFIIVLGETVLTMGTAFAAEPFALERLLALAIGFAGTVGLWWSYFQRSEGLGVEAAERADDPGAVGLWGTWTLTLIVLGLIAIAVGDELAIAHPGTTRRSASGSWRSAVRRCSCSPSSCSIVRRSAMPRAHARSASSRSPPSRSPPRRSR